jgi:hypothetical protein
MPRLNAALNLFWVVFGLGVCWQAAALGLAGPGGPGSGLFPMLSGLLIAVPGAALLIGQALRGGGAAATLAEEDLPTRFWRAPAAARRVGLPVAVAAAMILVLPHLGFAVTGALGLPLLYRTVEPEARWWVAILVGVLASAGVHLLFGVLLGTPLPRGLLGF